jgi:hypothetical protein
MTAQGQPASLRQAARPRSQRRWPLAPGHWAKLAVAVGGYLLSARVNSLSTVQLGTVVLVGLGVDSVTVGPAGHDVR